MESDNWNMFIKRLIFFWRMLEEDGLENYQFQRSIKNIGLNKMKINWKNYFSPLKIFYVQIKEL